MLRIPPLRPFGLSALLLSCGSPDGDGGPSAQGSTSAEHSGTSNGTGMTASASPAPSPGANTASAPGTSSTGAPSAVTTEPTLPPIGSASPGGTLDLERVRRAKKIQRRISLGDSDDDIAIADAAGGMASTLSAATPVPTNVMVDQITLSALGYCAVLEDSSVKCDFADYSAATTEFVASITHAESLIKVYDLLGVVDVGGGVRFWNGMEVISANAQSGTNWGGYDFETCFLQPDGYIRCVTTLSDVDFVDKTGFEMASKRYVGFAQSLNVFAAIDEQGELRVQSAFEDEARVYPGPYVQVAAHTYYWCMINNAGALSCVNSGLGGSTQNIEDVPEGEFLAVDVNASFACAVRTTGEVVCWGGSAQTLIGPSGLVRLD